MDKLKNAYKLWKHQEKRPLWELRLEWEDIITIDWIELPQDRVQ
jgi:hypothetical protein